MFAARQGFFYGAGGTSVFNPQINIIASGGQGQACWLNADGTSQLFAQAPDGSTGKFVSISLDELGVFDWQNELSPSTTDLYQDIAKDTSGNIYGCGFSDTDKVGFVTCQNSGGSIVWQKKFTSTVSSINGVRLSSLVYSNSYLYVVGSDSTTTNTFAYLYKINPSTGSVLNKYKITPGGAAAANCNCISADNSGNLYIGGGYTASTGSGTTIYSYIAKFNAGLTFTWGRLMRFTSTTAQNQIYSIVVDSSSNVYATFNISSGNGSNIVKFNSTGTVSWIRSYTPSSGTFGNANGARALGIDSSDNVYMVMHSISSTTNQNYITKISSTGTIDWNRYFKSTTSGVNTTLLNMSISDSTMLLVGYVSAPGVTSTLVFEIPTDGTKTGIYGTYNYNNSGALSTSVITSSYTVTNMASSPIATTTDITISDATKTRASTSFTQTITYL